MGTQDMPSAASSGRAPPRSWLSTLSYRSRATAPLSDGDIERLVRRAQIRNRSESITGMVIYDEGRFLQWLEGPDESLKRVVASINRDHRHTDIEVLGNQPTPVRLFEGWDLKLAHKSELAKNNPFPSLAATPNGLDDASTSSRETWHVRRVSERSETPGQTNDNAQFGECHDDVSRIVAVLMADRPSEVDAILQGAANRMSARQLFERIVEPAARALGDLHESDRCTEFEVTIGLVGLQTALRRVLPRHRRIVTVQPRRILVVPAPGEPHMLAAILNAEILWQSGWSVRCDFPATGRDLQQMLQDEWFDALAVSLSPAAARTSRLADVARVIAQARASSQNGKLAVVAGGRSLCAKELLAADVGADALVPSSAQVDAVLAEAIRRRAAMIHPSAH